MEKSSFSRYYIVFQDGEIENCSSLEEAKNYKEKYPTVEIHKRRIFTEDYILNNTTWR